MTSFEKLKKHSNNMEKRLATKKSVHPMGKDNLQIVPNSKEECFTLKRYSS